VSWANPIEAQSRRLQDYLRWRNATPAIPKSWPPSDANAPASAADDTSAGAPKTKAA
jgi:hypothetical protein